MNQIAEADVEQAGLVEVPEPDAGPELDSEIVELAREFGWKSEEDWKGDPPEQGFVSPQEYIEKPYVQAKIARKENEELRRQLEATQRQSSDTLARMENMHKEAARRSREAHAREIEGIRAAMRDAATDGDVDRYQENERLLDAAQANAPQDTPDPANDDPAVADWKQANPWFETDLYAKSEAVRIAGQVASVGGDTAEQIKAIERHMKQTMPHLFEAPKTAPKPSRVDGGGLAALGGSKSAFDALPPEAKAKAQEDVALGLYGSVEEWAAVYNGDA